MPKPFFANKYFTMALLLCFSANVAKSQIIYVTNQSDNDLWVIDQPTGDVLKKVYLGGRPLEPTLNHDYSRVYIPQETGNDIYVVNTLTDSVESKIDVGKGPTDIAIMPDNKTAYVPCYADNKVYVLDLINETVSHTIDVGSAPFKVVLSKDGSKAYIAHSHGYIMSVINTATNKVSSTINIPGCPKDIELSEHDNRIYISVDCETPAIAIINRSTETVSKVIEVGKQPKDLALHPNGKSLYVADQWNRIISIVDVKTLLVTDTIKTGQRPVRLGFSHGGDSLFALNVSSPGATVISTSNSEVIGNFSLGRLPNGICIFKRTWLQTQAVLSASQVQVYPNPSQGTIAVNVPLAAYRIEIRDVQGRTLLSQQVSTEHIGPQTIELSQLTGVYLLSIHYQGQTLQKKLIIED